MKRIARIFSTLLVLAMLAVVAHAYSEPVMYGEEQLIALLDNIDADIRPGTAGSTLRATARAAELMRWGMNTQLTEEQITETVTAVMDKISEDRMADVKDAMTEVYETYCGLLTDATPEMLQDAGLDPAEYDFTAIESVEAVETVMRAAGIIE